MSDREYLKKIVDALPDDRIDDAISHIMKYSDSEFDEKKFELAKEYLLEKYRPAFEELAK